MAYLCVLSGGGGFLSCVFDVAHKFVKDFEPLSALDGGEDGLYFYRRIFERAHLILKDRAMMAFEMGYDQGERLQELAASYFPDARIEVLRDLSGKNRMLFVYINL